MRGRVWESVTGVLEGVAGVPGLVDDTHAAFAELFENLVMGYSSANHEWSLVRSDGARKRSSVWVSSRSLEVLLREQLLKSRVFPQRIPNGIELEIVWGNRFLVNHR